MSGLDKCVDTRFVATYASEPTAADALDKEFILDVLSAPAKTVPNLNVDLIDTILAINALPANKVPKRTWDYHVLVDAGQPPAH